MGITPAQLAARYWGHAAQCLIFAQRQDKATEKLALINMAKDWVTLAVWLEHQAAEGEAEAQVGARQPVAGHPVRHRAQRPLAENLPGGIIVWPLQSGNRPHLRDD
jgi:hypothetical protein